MNTDLYRYYTCVRRVTIEYMDVHVTAKNIEQAVNFVEEYTHPMDGYLSKDLHPEEKDYDCTKYDKCSVRPEISIIEARELWKIGEEDD